METYINGHRVISTYNLVSNNIIINLIICLTVSFLSFLNLFWNISYIVSLSSFVSPVIYVLHSSTYPSTLLRRLNQVASTKLIVLSGKLNLCFFNYDRMLLSGFHKFKSPVCDKLVADGDELHMVNIFKQLLRQNNPQNWFFLVQVNNL